MSAAIKLRRCLLSLTVGGLLLGGVTSGEDRVTTRKIVLPESLATSVLTQSALLRLNALPHDWRQHPLTPALLYAAKHHQHIEDSVQDFTCILAKRERINGRLRDYEYLKTRVRRQQTVDGRVVEPFSVYAEFLAPSRL